MDPATQKTTTDDLKRFFVTDRAQRRLGADAERRIRYYAETSGADYEATVDRALVSRWLAARSGRNADEVSGSLDAYVKSYFGMELTPSAAYDVIAANYDKLDQLTPIVPKEEAEPDRHGFFGNTLRTAGSEAAQGLGLRSAVQAQFATVTGLSEVAEPLVPTQEMMSSPVGLALSANPYMTAMPDAGRLPTAAEKEERKVAEQQARVPQEAIAAYGERMDKFFRADKSFRDSFLGRVESGVARLPSYILAGWTSQMALGDVMATEAFSGQLEDARATAAARGEEYDPRKAVPAALLSTSLQTPLMMILPGKMLKVLGGKGESVAPGILKDSPTALGGEGDSVALGTLKDSLTALGIGGTQQFITDVSARLGYDPDRELFSAEEAGKILDTALINFVTQGVGSGVIRGYAGRRSAQQNPPLSSSEKTPPMPEDFRLWRGKFSDNELRAMPYGDILLAAVNGDKEAAEMYQALVKQEQTRAAPASEAEVASEIRTILTDVAPEGKPGETEPGILSLLREPEVTALHDELVGAVEKLFNETVTEGMEMPEGLRTAEEPSPEAQAIRADMEADQSKSNLGSVRSRAERISREAWLPEDEAVLYAKVRNALGRAAVIENAEAGTTTFYPALKRVSDSQMARLEERARAAHAALFERIFGELKGSGDLREAQRKFDDAISEMRRKAAERLVNSREVQEAIRARDLADMSRQRNLWRDRYRAEKSRESRLRSGMRMVQQLLPMEVRGALGKMRPPTEGFRSNGDMERWLDSYLDRAVELDNANRVKGIRGKIDAFLSRRDSALADAQAARKRLNFKTDGLLPEMERLRAPRSAEEAARMAELEKRGDIPPDKEGALTPDEQRALVEWKRPRLGDENLTPDDLLGIYDNLKELYRTGRDRMQAERAARAEHILSVSEAAAAQARPDPQGFFRKGAHAAGNWLRRNGMSGLLFNDTMLTQWSGKRDNLATRAIVSELDPPSMAYAKAMRDFIEHFRALGRKLGISSMKASDIVRNENGKRMRVNGKKVSYTVAMEWYALLKNEEAKAHLLGRVDEETGARTGGSRFNGEYLSESSVRRIVDALPENARQLVDEYIRYNDEVLYPRLNEWFRGKYGYDLPKAENYFPLTRIEGDLNLTASFLRMGKPRYIKGRTGSTAPIQDFDFFKKELAVVEQATRKAYFEPHMANLRDMFFNMTKQAVEDGRTVDYNPLRRSLDEFDPTLVREIKSYFDDVERGGSDKRMGDLERQLDRLRRNAVSGIVGLNPGSVMKVGASFFPGMRLLDNPAYAFQVFAEVGYNFRAMHDFMNANTASSTVRFRNVHYDQKALAGMDSAWSNFQRAGFFGMRAADELQVTALWTARYREVLARSGDHTEAVYQADKLIQDTQSSWEMKDMSRWYREGSLTLKTLLQFTNDANHTFNELVKDIAEGKSFGDLMSKALTETGLLYVMPALMMVMGDAVNKSFRQFFNYAFSQAFGTQEPDEIDWGNYLAQDTLYNGFTYPFQSFPVISDISQGLTARIPGWANEQFDMDLPEPLHKGWNTNQSLIPTMVNAASQGNWATAGLEAVGMPGANLLGPAIDRAVKEE